MDKYILTNSSLEIERLVNQSHLLKESSIDFIKTWNIKPEEKIIEIGCGTGGILDILAQYCLPKGELYGLELNQNFVEYTRNYLSQQNISGVQLIQGDILNHNFKNHFFDRITCRLLFIIFKEKQNLLNKMLELVKPGGWLHFQESVVNPYIQEDIPEFNYLLKLNKRFFESQGLDFKIGIHLPALLEKNGLQNITIKTAVPFTKYPDPNVFVLNNLIEITLENIIKLGLDSKENILLNLTKVRQHLIKHKGIFVYPTIFQISAQKPSC